MADALVLRAGGNQIKKGWDAMCEIPYPINFDTTSEGASSYRGVSDCTNSKYFKHPDFFNMKTDLGLVILENFKTYQQTKEYTCGGCCVLMVFNHFGYTEFDELGISDSMGSAPLLGTSTKQLVDFFKIVGWEVQSSIDEPFYSNHYSFASVQSFKEWLIHNLSQGVPIIVETVDWGGHWLVIIGYDTNGDTNIQNDVIIFADSYNTRDHKQDGYYTMTTEHFYSMWFDAKCLPLDQRNQQC